MRVFCYFVEPAAYTLDLAHNIHDKNDIDYCFIYSKTLAKSNKITNKIYLDRLPFFLKLNFLFSTYRNNDLIIINGYNNYVFLINFLINFFSFQKKNIAIESDTQLFIPANIFKRGLKWLYLSIIFKNKYILGFAGGTNSHKDLFRYYGMIEDRIFLMPMMVDNSKFLQKNKVFPDIFTFLYVGRLVKSKNVEGLIVEFNKKFADKKAVLKIIGSGDEEEFLRKKYTSSKVVFFGAIFGDDLISEFRSASCFVFPSELDAWGLVINEALSSSLPVITTKLVGSYYDLIQDKETGMIASDINEFGDMMLKIYNNSDLLLHFSKNAYYMMKDHWNYDLYNKCLKGVINKINL